MTNEQLKQFYEAFGEFWKYSTEQTMIESVEKLMDKWEFEEALEFLLEIKSAIAEEYGD